MTDEDAAAAPDAEDGSPSDAAEDEPEDGDDDSSHLDDLMDGAGCTEIWERLSERRAEEERERADREESERRAE